MGVNIVMRLPQLLLRKKFNNHQEPRKNIIEKLKKDAEKHPGNGQ
jgi:hypothetical protein